MRIVTLFNYLLARVVRQSGRRGMQWELRQPLRQLHAGQIPPERSLIPSRRFVLDCQTGRNGGTCPCHPCRAAPVFFTTVTCIRDGGGDQDDAAGRADRDQCDCLGWVNAGVALAWFGALFLAADYRSICNDKPEPSVIRIARE